jgi:hypothetical protein
MDTIITGYGPHDMSVVGRNAYTLQICSQKYTFSSQARGICCAVIYSPPFLSWEGPRERGKSGALYFIFL